jgi:hypothetical protein
MYDELDAGCDELLSDESTFHSALDQYVHMKPSDVAHKRDNRKQSVYGLLLLIDFVFDMLRDVGLSVHSTVYTAVRNKTIPHFNVAVGWHVCVLSKLPSRQCICVDDNTMVHEQYMKWLRCLWLATHIHDVERQRPGSDGAVPRCHAELYRASLCFVLQQLRCLYADLTTYITANITANVATPNVATSTGPTKKIPSH